MSTPPIGEEESDVADADVMTSRESPSTVYGSGKTPAFTDDKSFIATLDDDLFSYPLVWIGVEICPLYIFHIFFDIALL